MKNKLITFAIILLFVTACNKLQVTNTVTRQGKLYGYRFSSYVANGKVNFGVVDHHNAQLELVYFNHKGWRRFTTCAT